MTDISRLPSTKSNYMKLCKDLEVYITGLDVLKQKRELLINELMNQQYGFEEINETMIGVFNKINEKLEEILSFHYFKPEKNKIFDINIMWTSNMGVIGMDVELNIKDETLPYMDSFEGMGPIWDEIVGGFTDLFSGLSRWLKLYSTVYRLLREIEKTSKRVRSLENIFVPEYETGVKRIKDELEEKEREEFVIKKIIKEKKSG